jgi:hypothetical protein
MNSKPGEFEKLWWARNSTNDWNPLEVTCEQVVKEFTYRDLGMVQARPVSKKTRITKGGVTEWTSWMEVETKDIIVEEGEDSSLYDKLTQHLFIGVKLDEVATRIVCVQADGADTPYMVFSESLFRSRTDAVESYREDIPLYLKEAYLTSDDAIKAMNKRTANHPVEQNIVSNFLHPKFK